MKRISLYLTLICIAFGIGMSISSATTSTPSTAALIVGTAVGENAGNLLFDQTTGLPSVQRVSIDATPTSLAFTGTFWTQNAGWCTFGGLGEYGAKLTSRTGNASMTGFAWCQNAGWIAFAPRGSIDTTTSINSDVYLDNITGAFHGFAWSENLGWINMEGLMTDITPPSSANFKAFAASGSMIFTINDLSSTSVPAGMNYVLDLENWDTPATAPHTSITKTFSNLDFRKAKQYYLKITDPFGNSSEGNIQVVADVPYDTLNATNIGVTEASAYVGTFADSKVADATALHSLNLSLRDQYGNPVINESLNGVQIKTVKVRVAFNNNVDKDQSLSTGVLGDAIQFPATTFGGLSFLSGSVGTDSNASGIYSLNISSYAPTKAGYAFTNVDNVSLQKLSYEVSTSAMDLGGVSEAEKKDKFGTNNLKFSPALYIGSVTNADNWAIRQGYATNFSAALINNTTVSLTNPKIAHILGIYDTPTSTTESSLISYQDPSNISGGSADCNGFTKTITTFSAGVNTFNWMCDRWGSSNILMTPTSLNGTMGFSWTPKIIYAAPVNSMVKYTSEISYSYTNGGSAVKYPSYSRSNSSALSETGTISALAVTGTGVINQSVKILGMTSSRNNFNILQGNDSNKVASLTRTDIKNAIHKNVEIMTKGGATNGTKYQVYTGNKIFSTLLNKDTIIIKWGDLTIDSDITGSSAMRGIIVLKDDTGVGGNIYITKDVKNIAAVLYADKSIISGNGTSYYSDAQTATGQLFIEGSIISDNTIGGASMTPLKCPYNVTGCNDIVAKRYDLNFFRFYDGTGTPAIWVPSAGTGYPFVIQYDNQLQTAPPPGFSMAQ